MLTRIYGSLVAVNTLLARVCAIAIAILLGVIVVVMIASVVMRYGLGSPLSWSDDLSLICLVWMSLLGLMVGMRPGHLAVEGILHALPPAFVRLVISATYIAVLGLSVAVVWYGAAFVRQGMARIVPSMDWMMQGYVYLAVPVGFALIIPSCIEHALRPFLAPTTNDGGN